MYLQTHLYLVIVHVVIVHIANHQEIISTKSFLFHMIVNSWLHFRKEIPIGLKVRNILVGLNDAKGIDVAQLIWQWGCPTKAQKQPKSTENAFFGCFWAFVRQPHGHIHWATSMPFASFNPTNPRTHMRNFREKVLRIGDFKKWAFFESAILNFFFRKKKIFFCFIPMKISPNLYGRMDGSNVDVFPGFQKIPSYA